MKKIAYVIASLGGGGAEHVMVNIISHHSKRGHPVVVITLDPPSDNEKYKLPSPAVRYISPQVSIKGRFSGLIRCLHHIRYIRRILVMEKPFCVLSFMTPTNLFVIIACLSLPSRCVVSERVHPAHYSYGRIYAILRDLLYPLSDAVVVQTDEIAQWFRNRIRPKIHVVPNCVLRVCKRLESKALYKTVIAVGRLDHQKGFDLLLQSFVQIHNTFPDWKLKIIGDGPLKQALLVLSDTLGLSSAVTFLPFTGDLCSHFQTASVAVQPSRFEGFPNTLLEVMAAGLCVIASDKAGAMLISNNKNGLLFESENIELLSSLLYQVISDSSLRSMLSRNATNVITDYNCASIYKKWDAILLH